MAVQCIRGRDDVAAAAGSPFFDDGGGFHGASTAASSPCVDDGAGVDTVRALQHLQSRLARLDRERHEAEACSEVLREEISARELDLAQLAAEADAEHLPQEMREQHEVWLARRTAQTPRRGVDVD